MVRSLKRTVAALLAFVMIGSMTACSADKSWAVKSSSMTTPVGTYIFHLYQAYQNAQSKVKDTSKPVLEQQIDGKSAEAWIKEKALNYEKELLLVNDKMKELKITLTDTETKSISETTDTEWTQSSATLEKYGVSKTSFNLAYSDYYTKYQKIFNATYGKTGTKAVSDDDLKAYFEKNYTDFDYIYQSLYTTDASGNYAALSTEQTNAVKKEFDGYAADIKSGKMTMRQAADAFKTSSKATEDPLQSSTSVLDTTSTDELTTQLKTMKAGEVKAIQVTGNIVLIMKNDVTKKTAEYLKTDEKRSSVLIQMKGEDFTKEMETEAAAYKGATINQAALDSYKPSMFVEATSSAASTAAAAASSAAASTASAASSK